MVKKTLRYVGNPAKGVLAFNGKRIEIRRGNTYIFEEGEANHLLKTTNSWEEVGAENSKEDVKEKETEEKNDVGKQDDEPVETQEKTTQKKTKKSTKKSSKTNSMKEKEDESDDS